MRYAAVSAFVLLLGAGIAGAQELSQENTVTTVDGRQQPIDYSRDHLNRLFVELPTPPEVEDIVITPGMAQFRALGLNFNLGYLPFFAPFPGSVPTTTNVWPDPFSLTRTSLATTPRSFARGQALNREIRRINKLERDKAKAKVVVKVQAN
jgi:hypothetical protein